MTKQPSVTVKQNPIVIVRNFLFMELGGYAAFVIAGAFADYGAIYEGLSFASLVSYQSAEFLLIGIAELVITLLIFFSWFYTHYRITPQMVVIARGIFFRKKMNLPLDEITSVNAHYAIGGKLFGYGTLMLESASQKQLKLRFIPMPQKYAEIIMRFRGRNSRSKSPPIFTLDPQEILGKEEHEQLEFKTTMRWDMQTNTINRGLEKMVMKTIAAFLNSTGGQVVIGVDDKKQVTGMHHDYRTLTKQDRDGFENHFTHVFNSVIGAEFRQFIKLHFVNANGKELCIVNVEPASRPVFARFDNTEEFYVRTGNSTTPLKISEAASYLELWRKRLE